MRYRKAVPAKPESVARPLALRALFPAVIQLRVELDFASEFNCSPSGQLHILHPPSAASFRYPCPVAGCTGHFDLQEAVTQLLQQVDSSLTSTICCSGVRPQDRNTGKLCALELRYKLAATYAPRQQKAS
jgi:hypothetical protein